MTRPTVLLVNLGTPAAPTASALRTYLAEFLSDTRVVDLPRLYWWPILHGIILNTRPAKSAAKYAGIWTAEGSPLLAHTRRLTALVRERLGDDIDIRYAMRYGEPSLASVLNKQPPEYLLCLPLYPQYAAATTASSFDALFAALAPWRNQPALRTVHDFHDHPGYIAALAAGVRQHWELHGQAERLVMSFHGLPARVASLGDPYPKQCEATAMALATALGLGGDRWQMVYQSRFGREEWLRPYAVDTLRELPKKGVRSVDIVCPGFVADCLETLEEMAVENRQVFLDAGGQEYRYVPALNTQSTWVDALVDICRENLSGWMG